MQPALPSLPDDNPWIDEVELSNYGEVFLNPDLVGILRTAYERGVRITLEDGVNLNRCSAEALEALVKYNVRSMTCSIDGASQETYQMYRARGDFDQVMANIEVINAHKSRSGEARRSSSGSLSSWTTEYEIDKAREMATERGMLFKPKLAWDDDFSPLHNVETVRRALSFAPTRDAWGKEQGRGYQGGEHDRERGGDAWGKEQGRGYLEDICLQLWTQSQINWDGRLLGCCFNFWEDFGGNVFEQGLEHALGCEKLVYAKRMLRGDVPPDLGIPCATCSVYQHRRENGRWIGRQHVMVEWLRQTRMVSSIRRTRLWCSTLRPILRGLRRFL